MEHSHKRRKKSVVKSVLYGFLAFVLAALLFLLAICVNVRLTIFSQDFMMNAMAEQDYYSMVKDELKSSLKNLGHASGLSDDFVDDYVNSLDIRQIEADYISSFYTGDSTLVDTTKFKQDFRAALDKYIEDKGIDPKTVSEKNVSYMINNATSIYVNEISIPFFSTIAIYIQKYEPLLNGLIIGLAVAAAVIIALICFTNTFTHRRYRYICYAFTSAFICTITIPLVVFISGYISKVNLATRSLYNLFVTYFNMFFTNFYIYAGVYAIAAVLCFILFYTNYQKTIRSQ